MSPDTCLPYKGVTGCCDRCGQALPPRRRRWCSEGCGQGYWANHDWGMAREAALRRDGWTCQYCGRVGWADVPPTVLRIEASHDVTGHPATREDWAVALGLLNEHDANAELWRDHEAADRREVALEGLPNNVKHLHRAETRAAVRPWWKGGRRRRGHRHDLEVNHVNPRKGRGYQAGCHNHLDNLETLCRDCHRTETTRQYRKRKPERDQAWWDGYQRAASHGTPPPTIDRVNGGYHPDSLEIAYEGRRELIEAWLRGWRKGLSECNTAQQQLPLEVSA